MKVYNNWPNHDEFNEHIRHFTPFVSLFPALGRFPSPKSIKELGLKTNRVIDISCVPIVRKNNANKLDTAIGEFCGNPLVREKVDINLSTFMDYFITENDIINNSLHSQINNEMINNDIDNKVNQIGNEKKLHHWLHDTDLNLYLTQSVIYLRNDTSDNNNNKSNELHELFDEIDVPDIINNNNYYSSSALYDTPLEMISAWINVREIKSTLHYDSNHNLLCVVNGQKKVTLISPKYTPFLSPFSSYKESTNHSHLSYDEVLNLANKMNNNNFKTINNNNDNNNNNNNNEINESDGFIELETIVLKPGNVLFIPEGWWHQVLSDSCTIGYNFWFSSILSKLWKDSSHMSCYFLRHTMYNLLYNNDSISLPAICTNNIHNIISNNSKYFDSFSDFELFISNWKLPILTVISTTGDSQDLKNSNYHKNYNHNHINYSQFQNINENNDKHNLNSMRFVTCSFEDMNRLWVIYAEKFPKHWTNILLSLTSEACQVLLECWDKICIKYDDDDYGNNNNCSQKKDEDNNDDNNNNHKRQKLNNNRKVEHVDNNDQLSCFFSRIFDPCGDEVSQ
eukprot:gene15227-20512_t